MMLILHCRYCDEEIFNDTEKSHASLKFQQGREVWSSYTESIYNKNSEFSKQDKEMGVGWRDEWGTGRWRCADSPDKYHDANPLEELMK